MNFEIIKGDPKSTVVIHVPHASHNFPEDARNGLLLDNDELLAEIVIMADSSTDELAELVYDRCQKKPHLFINRISRLVIDPERFPDNREVMNSVGMGVVYTATHDRSQLRRQDKDRDQELISKYFNPYAQALSDLVELVAMHKGGVTIIDLHSYPVKPLPYELYQNGERPELCIGVDQFHTHQELVELVSQSFSKFGSLSINTPFVGTYVPTKFFGIDPKIQSVMIELRKDWQQDRFENTVKALSDLVGKI